jgi:hypothetical protein
MDWYIPHPARATIRRLRTPTAAFVVGAVAAGGLGGIAYAAIPHSVSGVISACRATTGTPLGRLRVIDAEAGQTCAAGETALSWNAKGITWRGAWSTTLAYRVNDAVSFQGTSYIARLANTGVTPTNTTNWAVLAAKGAAGATGPAGPAGLAGPAGPAGPAGAAGVSGYERVSGPDVLVAPQTLRSAEATCPSDKVPLGGGEGNAGGFNQVFLSDSFPTITGWRVFVHNLSGQAINVTPFVVCATAA